MVIVLGFPPFTFKIGIVSWSWYLFYQRRGCFWLDEGKSGSVCFMLPSLMEFCYRGVHHIVKYPVMMACFGLKTMRYIINAWEDTSRFQDLNQKPFFGVRKLHISLKNGRKLTFQNQYIKKNVVFWLMWGFFNAPKHVLI